MAIASNFNFGFYNASATLAMLIVGYVFGALFMPTYFQMYLMTVLVNAFLYLHRYIGTTYFIDPQSKGFKVLSYLSSSSS
jgi:hypothetical protein